MLGYIQTHKFRRRAFNPAQARTTALDDRLSRPLPAMNEQILKEYWRSSRKGREDIRYYISLTPIADFASNRMLSSIEFVAIRTTNGTLLAPIRDFYACHKWRRRGACGYALSCSGFLLELYLSLNGLASWLGIWNHICLTILKLKLEVTN